MKALTFFFALFGFMAVSCNDNDDKIPELVVAPQTLPPNIEGEWKLVNVSGGIQPINESFPEGMITWDFDTQNQTVTILNNNANELLNDGFDSGTYGFSLVIGDINHEVCSDRISFNDFGMYDCLTIQGNVMTMDSRQTDGYLIKFIR